MEKPFCYFSERFCSSLAQKIDFNSKKLRWQRFPNVTQREVLMVAGMPTGPTVNLSLAPAGAIGGNPPPTPEKNPPFWIPPQFPSSSCLHEGPQSPPPCLGSNSAISATQRSHKFLLPHYFCGTFHHTVTNVTQDFVSEE